MRKTNLLLIAFLLCSLGAFSVFAAGDSDIDEGLDTVEITDSTKTGSDDDTATVEADEDASKDSESITDKAKEEVKEKEEEEKEEEEEENDGLATLPDGIAYVGAFIGLNIRDGAWGTILTAIPNDSQVTICGREGDWYKISSPTAGYVHARYIFDSPGKAYLGNDPVNPNGSSSSSSGSTPDVIIDVDGDSLQGKIVSAAKSIHDQYQGYQAYPYHEYTEGGNLGCAQVATSVLCAAGALDATDSCGGLPYSKIIKH